MKMKNLFKGIEESYENIDSYVDAVNDLLQHTGRTDLIDRGKELREDIKKRKKAVTEIKKAFGG